MNLKRLFIWIMALVLVLPLPGIEKSTGDAIFDFSGVDQFFKIKKILEQDKHPSEEQWETLFQTPGYRVLIEIEFKRDFFIQYFQMAFMPSRADSLQKELERLAQLREKSFNYRWYESALKHYIQIRDHQDSILQFTRKIRDPEMVINARKKAMTLLPSRIPDAFPKIAFLIFGNDARGYDPVVMDIGYVQEYGPHVDLLFAHEIHHYYLDSLWQYDIQKVNKEDESTLWAMGQIYKEGIADQIDKTQAYFTEPVAPAKQKRADRFRREVDNTPQVIAQLDRILQQMVDSPTDRLKHGREFARQVPWSGHPTGYFMARAILNRWGPSMLIRDAGNPFGFFQRYQGAAQQSEGALPRFSARAIDMIRLLEKKYIVK